MMNILRSIKYGLICLSLFIFGCTSFVFQSPSGERCELQRWGYDTRVSAIIAHSSTTTQPAYIEIQNFDSQAKALQVADDAIKLLTKVPVTP